MAIKVSGVFKVQWMEGRVVTCVAHAGVFDLDAHLVGPRRQYLDILVAKLLSGAPGDSRLAGDGLRVRNVSEAHLAGRQLTGDSWVAAAG